MGKTTEVFNTFPLPEALEAHLKSFISVPNYDFLATVCSDHRVRNQITAEMLKTIGLPVQVFNDKTHGTDALLFRPGKDDIITIEFAEMKSCYVPDAGKRASYFEYGYLSAKTAERLAGEIHILSRFKKCPDGLDRLVDCHIIDANSPFQDFLYNRSVLIKGGKPLSRVRFTLPQMIQMGALRVI